MSKCNITILVVAFGLSACSSGVYETVTVRTGDTSCTENIRIDSSAKPGITVTGIKGSSSYDNVKTSIDLPSLPSRGEKDFNKRCADILGLAKQRVAIAVELDQIKLDQEKVELEMDLINLQVEQEELRLQYQDLESDF